MRIEGLRVTVVGAGTGGAATALLLARAGAVVTVLERAGEIRSIGAGIAIAANGMAVLESLGLGPALAHTPRAASPRIVDARGRTLLDPPPGSTLRLMRRSTLQRVLLDAVDAEPRIDLRLGVEAAAAEPGGRVRTRAAGGDSWLDADLVVGADGVHSALRTTSGVRATLRHGITYVRALAPAGVATGVEAWTSAGLFGSFAVDDGTYLYASAGTRAVGDALRSGDLPAFRAAWRAAYPPSERLLSTLERLEEVLVNQVVRVECDCWHIGRLVLVGDAAHAMAPNLGQGANSALVDAAVLLDELRHGAALAAALDAYQSRRRGAVRRVAALAARLGALAEVTNPAARWMRDRMIMPLAQRLARNAGLEQLLQEKPETLLAIGRWDGPSAQKSPPSPDTMPL